MEEPKRNIYVGHRYVPKIMGEWTDTLQYEGLSIVTYQGTSYTSKKHVPIGINILNTDYWVVTGNYNAQIEAYRKDVRDLEKVTSDRMDGIDMDIENVNTSLNEKIDSTKTNLQNEIQTTKSDLQSEISDVANTADSNLDLVETSLEQKKTNKTTGLVNASDYIQPEYMSDSDFIELLFNELDGYGTVQLEGRTYNLDRTLELDWYQTLQGVGHITNLQKLNGTTPIIKIKDIPTGTFIYGVQIKDLILTGNNQNTGIDLNSASHVTLSNLYIYETWIGVTGKVVWLAEYNRLTIRNHNVMGETGFKIDGGTSNLYNNIWVKNFRKGYDSRSIYTTFNSCACDTFIEYAYYLAQTTTLNGCGAEDGRLVEGSYVFGAGARSVTFNNCETLAIVYSGTLKKASIFNFNGTMATINGYRSGGTVTTLDTLAFIYVRGASYVTDNNSHFPNNNNKYVFDETNATSSVIYAKDGSHMGTHRWNGYQPIYPAP